MSEDMFQQNPTQSDTNKSNARNELNIREGIKAYQTTVSSLCQISEKGQRNRESDKRGIS